MVKPLLKILTRSVLILVVIVVLYGLAAFSLPLITVNNSFTQEKEGVRILIISNGVHTDIALPVISPCKDWSVVFPKDSFDVRGPLYSYIAFGWGDKGFYLDTPTWSDLTLSTASRACFGLGNTAMHVRYLKDQAKIKKNCVAITISESCYAGLVHYIECSFKKQAALPIKINHRGYGYFDRFYEAEGTYSLFNTCNIWTGRGLQQAGIKVASWSPFASSLMSSLGR